MYRYYCSTYYLLKAFFVHWVYNLKSMYPQFSLSFFFINSMEYNSTAVSGVSRYMNHV